MRTKPASPKRPDVPTAESLLACALGAAQAAGGHALKNWSRRREVLQSFAHDVKLALDLECQRIAEKFILRQVPGHRILGEEGGQAGGGDLSACEWVIDPIDGTVNFSHGLPLWCCSIAVRHGTKVLAGVVYAPATQECYTAARGIPPRRNGEPIHVSQVARLADAVILTGLDKRLDPRLPPFEVFRTISANVQKARIFGTAALDICRVAAGQADGYFETGIYIWDVAAAGFIVEQAGGKTDTRSMPGEHRLRFIASNRRIHAPLRKLIAGALGAAGR